MSADSMTADDARALIPRLEAQLDHTDDPDSILFELAIAHRIAGELDDRLTALVYFDRLRPKYGHEHRYLWERAKAYEASNRPSNARECLEEIVASDSTDIVARNEIARLRVQEMLRHYDFHDIVALLDDMAATRRLDPTNAQTLYLESYLDYLATRNPDADRLALSRQGCSRLDELLATSPGSVDAKLLRAVHLTELRLWDEADLQFRTAIDSLPPDRKAVFESLPPLTNETLTRKWEGLAGEERARLASAVWRGQDPTPLTPVDENRIEYWSRLVLADLLFGRTGAPGWATDPGRVFLRYGFPEQNVFSPGKMEELPSEMQKHPYYQGVTRATIQKSFAMEAPAWSWTYRFPGRSFEVKFLDQTYQGRYVTADESTKLLAELESSSPTSFGDALPGRITRIFATTAATAAGTAATAPTAGSIGAATIVGAAASAASASGAATASTAATVGAAASAASVSGPATAATTTTTSSAAASAPASASGEAVTRYHVAVGLPPWLRDRPDDWWRQTDVEVVIRDAKYEKVAFRKRRVQAESVYRPDSGGEMIVYADDFDLPPGEYWLEAQVVDQHIDEHGSMRRRLEVPDFRDGRLRMSDLELAFPMDSTASGPAMSRHGRRYRPNPLAMVGDARRLNVLYEIYHVPDPAAARIQARYTILPRGYVVGIADLIRRGVIAADDPRRFGSLGMQLGGITLTRENYSDLYFPEEVVQADSAGIIPRGAALDLTDLQAGEYAVIATVTELASGQSASAIVGFRVTSDAELKALLDP